MLLRHLISIIESNLNYLSQILSGKDNPHFLCQNGMRIFWTDDIPSETAKSIKELIDSSFSNKNSVVKSTKSRTVVTASIPQVGSGDKKIFIKKYIVKSRLKGFLNTFAPSKAWREMYLMKKLFDSGIPTTRPLLVAEKRCNSMLRESYLITEEVPDSQNFLSFIRQNFSQEQRREFLAKLADFILWIHNKGFFHSDLTLKNILVSSSDNKNIKLLIMDLDNGVFTKKRISSWNKAKNLLQLFRLMSKENFFNEGDRVFFVNSYCKTSDSVPAEELLKRIERVRIYSNIKDTYRKFKKSINKNK